MGARTTTLLGVLGGALRGDRHSAGAARAEPDDPRRRDAGAGDAVLGAGCLPGRRLTLSTRSAERIRGSMLIVAVLELRATATRSIALAGVGALAVYGSVAVRGAEHDLLRGLDQATVEYFDTGDIWVTTGDNDLTTSSFRADGARAALAALARCRLGTRLPGWVPRCRGAADVDSRALSAGPRDPAGQSAAARRSRAAPAS